MIVGKLVLRSSAGRHGPKGNFTVLYDGEGELKFGLVRYHTYHNGKGKPKDYYPNYINTIGMAFHCPIVFKVLFV